MDKYKKDEEIETYLFHKQQLHNRYNKDLQDTISRINSKIDKLNNKDYDYYLEYLYKEHKIDDKIIALMDNILNNNELKFTFGKYKDYYVDQILVKDKEYCKWFIKNIRGKDANTLLILDYLNKKVNGENEYETRYYIEDPKEVLLKITMSIPMRYHSFIDNDNILSKFTYSKPKYKSYDISYADYNNITNEFCYYGDMILDYGDFC